MADDWRELNRANWDERVAVHLGASDYDLAPLRAGRGRLNAIEEAELGPVGGLRVLHLQCHFGRDSLVLAGRGAEVTGLDFSGPAVVAARSLAAELGLAARFVQADLYDAPEAVPEPASFDLVYTTETVQNLGGERNRDVTATAVGPASRCIGFSPRGVESPPAPPGSGRSR